MGEIDFSSENQELTAHPEIVKTQAPEAAETAPETEEATPEATEEQTPHTVGYMSDNRHMPGRPHLPGQPLGKPGEFYSDPECKHPLRSGQTSYKVYDAHGRLVSFGRSSEVVETPSEAGEVEPESGENASEDKESEETVGYSSDYYLHRMGDAISSGNRIAYKNAERNYGQALAKERAKKIGG